MWASCSLRLKPALSNTAETELKCNTGFREHITLAFYHTQTVGASSLLLLIYAVTVCLCLDNIVTNIASVSDDVLQNGVRRKKILPHSLSSSVEVPVTTMRGRVHQALGM